MDFSLDYRVWMVGYGRDCVLECIVMTLEKSEPQIVGGRPSKCCPRGSHAFYIPATLADGLSNNSSLVSFQVSHIQRRVLCRFDFSGVESTILVWMGIGQTFSSRSFDDDSGSHLIRAPYSESISPVSCEKVFRTSLPVFLIFSRIVS